MVVKLKCRLIIKIDSAYINYLTTLIDEFFTYCFSCVCAVGVDTMCMDRPGRALKFDTKNTPVNS